ncbi:MAG TPA: HAMP domain-containing sensor histidine kinase, partial [Polyangia bacterium]|nr:HAMP domain-containing sensor histidine kinase [Polyangia bacterium]
ASAPEAACALERRAERVTGADADRILAPGARRKLGLRSLVVVPLAAGSRPIGVLTLAARRDFSDADLRTAEAYARRAALAIAHARSHEEARRALAARDELLAIVAHDLQNLIATIGLSATLLARVERDGDRRRGGKQIELIRSTNERMRHLVGDLLDGARMESGRFTLRPTRSTMGSLLRAAAEIAQPLADERGLRLVCDPADEEVELRCDEPRVLQVLTNLLRNAIKFTPRGTVTLRARRHGGEARFEVVDQGVGVPPEQAARVFERYWTIDGQQGTGLGLYIARHIVEAHGGALRLDSAPGRGSTFWFTLPLAPAAKPKDARR